MAKAATLPPTETGRARTGGCGMRSARLRFRLGRLLCRSWPRPVAKSFEIGVEWAEELGLMPQPAGAREVPVHGGRSFALLSDGFLPQRRTYINL